MIKILDSSKSLASLVNDTTNGLGKLQPLDAFVTEELNGIYEAEIVIAQTDKHFNDLALNGLLKITVSESGDEQIFRVYFISKPIDGKILIKAQHISYDLSKVPVKPFISTGAVNTKNKLLENIMGTYPFDMMTDILNNTSNFTLEVPKSFRECLGGWEGSVLDTFRCEYQWDNLLVKMLAHRGSDNGVRIAYGKNLTDFKQEENIENVYTSVLGYAVVNDTTYVGDIYHKIVSNLPKVKIVDFSDDFGDIAPTTAQLTQKAQEYATNNAIEVPNVSIDIKFVPLYQTEEYKNIAPLERVFLGDTVHVFFEKLNVEATSRVVKTVWNVNLNRYESIELGDTKANLTTLLDDAVQEAKENITIDAGFIENEMLEMSQLIINGLGLHRTLVPLATGGYRMYLHNKPTLAESDTQYVISAGGFMVSTDYGHTWNSGWDADGNVVVNSLSTIVLKALEIYGSYLCFGDYPNGKYIEASTYSVGNVQQGVSFDGTGTIRMQPQDAFIVNNKATGNNNYNKFIMNRGGTFNQNYVQLINYDDTQNYIVANSIELEAHVNLAGNTYNRLLFRNYGTTTGTSYLANHLDMEAYGNRSSLYLSNYKSSVSGVTANGVNLIYYAQNSYMSFYNYNHASSRVANLMMLESYPVNTTNRIALQNFLYDDGTLSSSVMQNVISLTAPSQSDVTNQISLVNYKKGQDTVVNRIDLLSGSSSDKIEIVNTNNSIKMLSDYANSITIRNDDVNSGRYNQLQMENGGNFNMHSSDDMNLQAADICRIEGLNTMVVSGGSVQLWIGSQRVTLYLDSGYVKYS